MTKTSVFHLYVYDNNLINFVPEKCWCYGPHWTRSIIFIHDSEGATALRQLPNECGHQGKAVVRCQGLSWD